MRKTKNESNSDQEMNDFSSEFEIDPSLMGEEFNCRRTKRFPYAIVVNAELSGIFIPEKSLIRSGWVSDLELIEKDMPGNKETGIFLTEVRMIILGFVNPYLKYKDTENVPLGLRGTVIDWYDSTTEKDKKTMDAVSEHLVMFLDSTNNFLHETPIRVRFKNVALWSLREGLEKYYSGMEYAFARITNSRHSSKDDKWRSLCVVDIKFKGVKEGQNKANSFCCKSEIINPTVENFGSLFLGTPSRMKEVIDKYDTVVGFDEQFKLLLPEQPRLALPGKDSF
ncbi:MAG: DUF5895 domain-containing protein [Dolichospermum sp.]